MRMIELDGREWRTVEDFYRALLAALGAPSWHGGNVNALVDSMIWGGINAVEPPYTVRILNARQLPQDIREEIDLAAHDIAEHRAEFQVRKGYDVNVRIEIM
jgi:RNAse (barnase) inhibitor barstar